MERSNVKQVLRRSAALVPVATAMTLGTARADAFDWNVDSGPWNAPASWLQNAVPTAVDDVRIARPAPFGLEIALTGNAAARSVGVVDSNVRLALNGFALTTDALTVQASAGQSTVLQLLGGTTFVGTAAVGNAGGGTATLSINAAATFVAQQSVTVAGGGYLDVAGTLTTASLDASSANVVSFTAGTMTIAGGTYVPRQTGVPVYTGTYLPLTNSLSVSGYQGTAARPTLVLADGATMTLAGTTSTRNALVVGHSGGRGGLTVDGPGSAATLPTGPLNVGAGGVSVQTNTGTGWAVGDGVVTLTNGGTLTAGGAAYIGYSGGVGVANVDGAGSTLGVGGLNVGAGRDTSARPGDGTLNATAGAKVTAAANSSVGSNGGIGRISVAGSTLNVTGGLNVGIARSSVNVASDGSLALTDGGQATVTGAVTVGSAGGKGRLTVDGAAAAGAPSKLTAGGLTVGDGRLDPLLGKSDVGTGTLGVTRGGQIAVTAGSVYVGYAGAVGTAIVDGRSADGTPSKISVAAGNFVVGDTADNNAAPRGTVAVTHGGQVSAYGFGNVGTNTGTGTVTVSGPGSKLSLGLGLTVGSGATTLGATNGTLTVADGGTLLTGTRASSTVSIGVKNAGGVITVGSTTADVSTWAHTGTLQIGSDGTTVGSGELNVNAGGQVSLAGGVWLYASTSTGRTGGVVNLAGGTLTTSGVQLINTGTAGGRIRFTGGTLRLAGVTAPFVTAPIDVAGTGGTIDTAAGLWSTVSGVVTDANGGTGGLTKTGAGAMSLVAANTYTGVTTVSGGTLTMSAAAYGNVLGNAGGLDVRDGVARFDFTGSTSPLAQIKSILTAGYTNGFASGPIRSSTATAGRGLGYGLVANLPTVRATYYGDADLDGDVDFNDFLSLQSSFGSTAGVAFTQGDFNYDGAVDFNDFLALQGNFGRSVTADVPAVTAADIAALTSFATANASVPEPTALALGGMAALGLFGRRRR